MRSRSCTMEGPDDGYIQPKGGLIKEEEEKIPEMAKRKIKAQQEEKDRRTKSHKPGESQKTKTPQLSRRDLIQLLGIMEGEVQAREDVIGLLKSERTGSDMLEAHYGSAVPIRPLQALQRDAELVHGGGSNEDVYEAPMAELDRLEDKQKETYRRMLEQLLLAEKCHRRTVTELDNEKRKHADFINKSDDFTNLLEQDRERLKRLLEQEKAYHAHKDNDHHRKQEKLQAELVKLKSFALILVDERQLHMEQINQQGQKIQDLTWKLQEKEQHLAAASDAANENGQKVMKLDADLEHQQAKYIQEHEEMTSKLARQETQNQELRLKLDELVHRMEELEESKKLLQKSEDELQELREKLSRGECGNSSLMAELTNLRKKVLEMEGKDEEIMKIEGQCCELRKRLQEKENNSQELRLEVDTLQKKMSDLEKLEGVFNRSKTESSQLHANLEKERRVVRDLASELDRVKIQLKELELSESKLQKAEMVLKDDLMKFKSLTVLLVDERKTIAERLKQEEEKSDNLSKMLKAEQGKITEVTEKLIEESKTLLKLKSEMEIQVTRLTKEKDELRNKVTKEEEKCQELNNKVKEMKISITELEDKNRNPGEDNKVTELTLEIKRLKGRLKQLEVVEGDLMKTEDEYDLLEKKFRTEQDKANTLSELVEELKSQINRNKGVERGNVKNPEAELRIRCRTEEEKTQELQAEIQALKEKIHELMNAEDQLSLLQSDFSILQRRLLGEEEMKKSMSCEVENLTRELEAAKLYGRAFRPSMNGRRMVDVPVTSTAVQTDLTTNRPTDNETTACFIRKSVLEENHLMSNLRQQKLKKSLVLDRYPPASAELGARRSSIPWVKKKEAITLTKTSPGRASSIQPPPGQPLLIRVMPDHNNSTATLEITNPRAEDFVSSTTIIPTLGLQKPRITIVPNPPTLSSKTKDTDLMGSLNPARSPVTITAISSATSLDRNNLQSPVSVITVSATPIAETCSPSKLHEVPAQHTVVKIAPVKEPEPTSIKKYNSNIITTEDNKIHIHLGPPLKRPSEGGGSPGLMFRASESSSGTVLHSPRQPSTARTTATKMKSSIMITPTSSAASRPTQALLSSDVQPAWSTTTRIPVAKGMKANGKAVLDMSTVTRLESRGEGKAMKIELRKSTVCSSASAAGAKS
ncbi:filamin-A-interacting protein 1 [Xenentodon cancila]